MGASEKFVRGQRVQTTIEYVDARPFWRGQKRTRETGIVTGFSRDDFCVGVLKEGQKSTAFYSVDFWEPITESPV
mgnify:CR=1 FL=1